MEAWEKQIIKNNLVRLIEITKCTTTVLTTLHVSNILCDDDVADLNAHAGTPKMQNLEFYSIIQKRVGGFEKLLSVLNDTNQTGPLQILTLNSLNYEDSFRCDQNEELGKGTFATVFKGECENRPAAVKRLFRFDESRRKRIENEIEILKLCGGNSNIVQYFTQKSSVHFDLIVLERCDVTLKKWISDKSLIQITRRKVMENVTQGLEWLHSFRILHRNVIPENILLKANRRIPGVKLAGFGSSVQLKEGEDSCVISSDFIETLGWSAPEDQGDSRRCTFASDVYSLGHLFCHVLTDGKASPNDLKNLENLEEFIDDTNNDCVKDILNIKQMISDDPKERPSISVVLISSTVLKARDANDTEEPSLLPFIEKMKENVKNGGKINGSLSRKLEEQCIETNVEAQRSWKRICHILNKFNHIDVSQPALLGLKELLNVERNLETVAAILPTNEDKNILDSAQKASQQSTDDESENLENSFLEDQSNDDENLDKIRQIVDELQNLNSGGKSKRLFEIVRSSEFCIIKQILNITASQMRITEICDDLERTLLHAAVEYREYDVVEYLVNARGFGNVLDKSIFQNTLIHDCLKDINTMNAEKLKQKHAILEFLITKNPRLIESKDKYERTPLHIAVMKVKNNEQVKFIETLLNAKASVNAKDVYRHTPLHIAVCEKTSQEKVTTVIRLLIKHGADPDTQDKWGRTFLHFAAPKSTPSIFQEIVEHLVSIRRTKSFTIPDGSGWQVLHCLAVGNWDQEPLYETLQLFRTHGVNFNALCNSGATPMFKAIEYGRSESFLKMFTEFGADWKINNNDQDTILHIAAYNNNKSALKYLLCLGCDVNSKNIRGDTPLHDAINCSSLLRPSYDVVNELLINGANPTSINHNGESPIYLALKRGNIQQRILDTLENVR
ncbi:unnamed protein product [Orchesella dallaii]|uniref:Protein kinase domain-containing protein n=1 Tax=Orchesella dallaii TaxID=48710 RepID=A0ABP1R0I8_9HEXA